MTPEADGGLRALFVNEGNLGTFILGQAQLDAALAVGLPLAGAVEARFTGIGLPSGLGLAAATRRVPGLAGVDLDLQDSRWHAVQALRARRRVAQELDAAPADVLHVHSHSIALAMGPEMSRIPTALSVDVAAWEWRASGVSAPLRRHSRLMLTPSLIAERRAFERADLVLAWSAWSAGGVRRSAPGARIVEHHPGLDLERFTPGVRSTRARPRVLFVGGRFALKGGEDLIAALAPMLGTDVDLDLVTPQELEARDGVTVHRLSSGEPELIELFRQADVLCLPTHADAVPWVVLEAMGCGTPVVASDVGAIPDEVGDEAGAIVPARDVMALRATLERVLGDGELRRRMGEAGRRRCEERYDARRQIPEMVDLLRGIAGRRSSR